MSSPAATASRRKSGRAVKAPEKFVPEVTSSHAGPAGSKRKRTGEDAENDASDVEDEPDESEEEIESEGEEARKPRRKPKAKTARKPAAKKPKVNGNTTHEDAPAPAIRLAARPKKPRKVPVVDEDAEGLYGM